MPSIDVQAAYWVARQDRGPLQPAEQEELQAWLDSDPRCIGALLRAQAVFIAADRAAALGPGFQPPAQARAATEPRRRWLAFSALVAVLVASIGLSTLLWKHGDGAVYQTGVGGVLSVPLPDGSALFLNSDTRLRVRYDAQQRHLQLERGEVLVNVARDPERPLRVQAGSTDVVAIGTSFSVRRIHADEVEVVVREGIVDVRRANEPETPVRVVASHAVKARAGAVSRIESWSQPQVERRLAWREGMIAFEGIELVDAAAEFSRYSRIRILIPDEQVARKRVVGLFASTDPVGFMQAVALSHGLEVKRVDEATYELHEFGRE